MPEAHWKSEVEVQTSPNDFHIESHALNRVQQTSENKDFQNKYLVILWVASSGPNGQHLVKRISDFIPVF